MTTSKVEVGKLSDFLPELGLCAKVCDAQIAIFHLPQTEQEWFAIDNYNPQNKSMVLSRGLIGDQDGVPYVACPLHKYRYSLSDGSCLTDEQYSIKTHTVIIEGDKVYVTQ